MTGRSFAPRRLVSVLAAIAAGTMVIPLGFLSTARAASSLIFERPSSQGPGTPGFGIASDSTVRPFQAPGNAATIGITFPIDFQGHGRPDLLACHGPNSPDPEVKVPCRVLRPQPDGSVIEMTRQMFGTGALPSMVNPRETVAGDFNGDGHPDVFVAAHGYDAPPYPGETNVVLISNPDGTYADRSSALPQTPDFSHSACTGDINGDGHLDIYVGNIGSVGPYFLMGKGDGTFTKKASGLPQPILNAREAFLSCLLVDVDQDEYPDLVLGTHAENGFFDDIVLINDRAGDFTRRPRLVLPRPPLAAVLDIETLDINRDGRPDLITVSSNTSSASGYGLQLLINQGTTFDDETIGRMGTAAVVSTSPNCSFVRLADFNGDGWEDLYCSDGPETVSNRYWISSANGNFTPVAPGVLPPGSGLGIHAVDFDGDGRPDLVSIRNTTTGDIRYQSYLNRTPFSTLTMSRALLRLSSGLLNANIPARR